MKDKSANCFENCPLTPALLRLLEAAVVLGTTDAKVLAAHLFLSPCTVRTEFQRVLTALNVHCRYDAVKMARDNGWLKNWGG